MKIAVVGKNKGHLERQLRENNFRIDQKQPWIVISYGGDGTVLLSERLYPGIPKLFLRHNPNCNNCSKHNFSKILKALENRDFKIKNEPKIIATINNERLIALNEINIHNTIPYALRFQTYIGNKLFEPLVIGDGIIVATPFGSTAYYQSITNKTFKRGLGLAYINPMRHSKLFKIKAKNKILNDRITVRIKIVRGPGALYADNNKKIVNLKEGDIITINRHKQDAKFIILNKTTKF